MNNSNPDFSKYSQPANSTQPTSLGRVQAEPQEKPSPIALILLGAIGVGVAISGGSVIPGMIHQAQIESAVASRLQADGVTQMSPDDAAKELETALPLVDPQTKELALINWETIVRSPNYPAGKYFGQTIVVVKGLNGTGQGSPSDRLVTAHRVGNITPEQAFKRLTEVKAAMPNQSNEESK